MRILGVLRLSRTDAASTSIERQREAVERWAALTGHEITAWAIDEDVSGDVAPWARPDLGQYLPRTLANRDASPAEKRAALAACRAGEWDALVTWNLDRLSRRAADLLAVIDWARAEGRPVFDTQGTEYTGPAGAITVAVLGGLAQGERERMVARARSSFDKLSREGRWRGGTPPFGYRVATGEDGHKRLAVDPDAAALVRALADRIRGGESANGICADLNRHGVPTPSGRGEWRTGNLMRVMTSDRMLGQMVREETQPDGGRREYVVRGADGLPVQRAEAILTRSELDEIRAILSENRKGSGRQPGARLDRALLLRVLWCWECATEGRDEPMYRVNGGRGQKYYRCGSRARQGSQLCTNGVLPCADVDDVVTRAILGDWGHKPVTRRVWVQGNDVAARVAEITEALAQMREDRAAGMYSTTAGLAEFRATYSELERRREELMAQERIPSGWREEETGETLADRWQAAGDDAARNAILRASGVRFYVERGTGKRGQDVASRLRVAFRLPGEVDADQSAEPMPLPSSASALADWASHLFGEHLTGPDAVPVVSSDVV
ncbi:recombinase family protein [Cellulomonas xiejunii]|uniref:Recombinase family protein n=1 Tax=Cellulomonas xiejunii TaxID=2968083 RepID=A0ABY5KRY3_9CELL|nr:recombinase family protein [Cellulomonas xiejunii]MCC2321942.1 recombinase family protein [Cellulomonas xiejunii]UUI73242.1 recombinase family protein [Cellulomonas xiejunii]